MDEITTEHLPCTVPVLVGTGDTPVTEIAQPCPHGFHNPVGESEPSPVTDSPNWWSWDEAQETVRAQRRFLSQLGGQGGHPRGGGTQAVRSEQDEEQRRCARKEEKLWEGWRWNCGFSSRNRKILNVAGI